MTRLVLAVTLIATAAPPAIPVAMVAWGDTIVWIADLSESRVADASAPGRRSKLGYHFKFFNLVGLDLWTYGGSYCVYDDSGGFRAVSALEAEALVRPETLRAPPLEYRYPMGLVALAVVLVLGLPVAIIRRRVLNRAAGERSLLGR